MWIHRMSNEYVYSMFLCLSNIAKKIIKTFCYTDISDMEHGKCRYIISNVYLVILRTRIA